MNKYVKILLFGPYLIWKGYVKSKIDEVEFISTFRFAVAITLVPFWIIAIGILLWSLVSLTVGACFVVAVILLDLWILKL